MSRTAKRKYRKIIKLHYEYIDSPESEKALAEVFDDIFIRIIKKRNTITNEKVDESKKLTELKINNFIVDNS